MKRLIFFFCLASLCYVASACGGDDDLAPSPVTPPASESGSGGNDVNGDDGPTPPPASSNVQMYVGGDVSLLAKYEAHGTKWLDGNGEATGDLLLYMRDKGKMNTVRLRLFVDPSKASADERGWGAVQDLDYVKTLGKRVKDADMQLLLDFHYSDSWADPAKQFTPDEWAGLDENALYTKIYDYTADVLRQMVAAGATPDLIQTGNEISYGMLWGKQGTSDMKKCYMGSNDNWQRFTTLLKKAGKACRDVCPEAKIILHTERVATPDVQANFYTQMKAAAIDYDIIGLSYYPYYHGDMRALDIALSRLERQFADKRIMIVETGYGHNANQPKGDYDISAAYSLTSAGQQSFARDLVAKLKAHPNVNGLIWWSMESNEYGATTPTMSYWYECSLFDNQTGKVLPAFFELGNLNN